MPLCRRPSTTGIGTAVVIGGGLAGVLAAWALRDHVDQVMVIERDRYPTGSAARPGVPQAHHAHLLLEAGHRALEELMPGVRAELSNHGATRVAMSRELRWLTAAGWMAETDTEMAFLSVTRPVLDYVVRMYAQRSTAIQFLEYTEVVGLLGSPHAVTGVRLQRRGAASARQKTVDLPAELVIDASGRRSQLPRWLMELGAAPIREDRVDAGVAYVSRAFHRPATDPGFRALYLQTSADHPWTGSLFPVEGGRWIVSVGGMRGCEPHGEAGFTRALRQLRDPILLETLRDAEPAGRVRGFRPGASVRRHFEDRDVPDGVVAVGDAATAFNPVYGQGCTIAALDAQALRAAVTRWSDISAPAARAARRGIAAASWMPWLLSSSEDARFPATIGRASTSVLTPLQHRAFDRVLHCATIDPLVASTLHEVMSMVATPAALFRPRVLAALLRGRGR